MRTKRLHLASFKPQLLSTLKLFLTKFRLEFVESPIEHVLSAFDNPFVTALKIECRRTPITIGQIVTIQVLLMNRSSNWRARGSSYPYKVFL
jgi:hypothetical protein